MSNFDDFKDVKASNTTGSLRPNPNVKLPNADTGQDVSKLQSQEEIDRETSRIRLQSEKLKLQREILELEKLTDDIEKIRAEKSSTAYAHETVEDSLKFQRESMREHQEACQHKKGGEATQLLGGAPSMGSDANNYALLQHTFTSGVIFRMCMRCGKTWFPKDPDYAAAMRLPTRNSPSTGSPSPGLTRHPERVRMVSEIEHRVRPGVDVNQTSSGPEGY
jgi:hypothetical protein